MYGFVNRIYSFLDKRIFPVIISFATHRLHITFMMVLWIALIAGGSFTAFELVGGNYTNGLSGLLGCIILMQQQVHQASTKELHDKVDAMSKSNSSLHQKIHELHEKLTAH